MTRHKITLFRDVPSNAWMVQFLGMIFAEINPRFDHSRWEDACNGRPYKK